MSTAHDAAKAIQQILGVTADGKIGPRTRSAFDALAALPEAAAWPVVADDAVHHVKASSFADPADIRRFRVCKAEGKSDQECFKVGDNGIGKWGDDCTAAVPICALPPEDWQYLAVPRGQKVLVTANNASVVCELRDTMPHRVNITNGAGIDLNEAACLALGLRPPMMVDATWQFV